MAEATSLSGTQLITYDTTVDETTPRWGFAQYVNKGGLRIFFGTQSTNGLSSLQCWEGKNPGCEVGVDTSKYKKFADVDYSKFVLTVNGTEYRNTNTNRKTYGYDAGLGDATNLPIKISFMNVDLLNVLKENEGNNVEFKISFDE